MSRAALAVDLGGTELRAAMVGEAGDILAFASTLTDAAGGPEAVIGQIAALLEDVRLQAPERAVAGLGVGAPGPLDPVAGISIAPPTLAGWRDVPLASLLASRTGLEVTLENDANAAALGEWRFGAGSGTQSMVFATISTGIGGGVIADGRLLRGYRGLAGEIGHMAIAESGDRCACGAVGCFEALASGTALGRAGARLVATGRGDVIRDIAGAAAISARHVAEAARAGDVEALALLGEEGRLLGIGLTSLLHLYSPERLVLGGGVSELLELLREPIEATIRERAMPAYREVPVLAARLGRHAGLIGAASLVFQPA